MRCGARPGVRGRWSLEARRGPPRRARTVAVAMTSWTYLPLRVRRAASSVDSFGPVWSRPSTGWVSCSMIWFGTARPGLGAASPDIPPGGRSMFEVELDIFSGRPNPRWTLDAAEESELITRLLDRSVPIGPVAITDGKLGYRGFVVRANGATAVALAARGLPTAFRVRDGLASTIDLAAEQWLLISGSASGLDPRTAARGGGRISAAVPEALPIEHHGLQRLERLLVRTEQLLQLRRQLAHRQLRPARRTAVARRTRTSPSRRSSARRSPTASASSATARRTA